MSANATPSDFTGTVTHVTDGDTLWVQIDPTVGAAARQGKPVKLRLVGIDAPERCQAHGPQATAALAALVQGRHVEVHRRATDGYGRALGTLRLGAIDVAAVMVREGHAWSARFYSDPGPYTHEERMARIARRGLFAAPRPQLPSDFRREHGLCS